MKLGPFLVRQKFRFDMGQGFLSVINFIFVVIAASDKLSTLIHLSTKVTLLLLVPSALLFVWLSGYILDKLKFYDSYQAELNERNTMLKDIHKNK